jgi:uncharacterized protein
MKVTVNLWHLEKRNQTLEGEISVAEMDMESFDELVQLPHPLRYQLEVEKLDSNLLVRGQLSILLACECARCLRPFEHRLDLSEWACHIPLVGEDAPPILEDSVDLTPFLREDILLAVPQRPVCGSNCEGMVYPQDKPGKTAAETNPISSPWAELNKLKL